MIFCEFQDAYVYWICICAHVYVYMFVYMDMHKDTYMDTHVYTCTYTHTQTICAYLCNNHLYFLCGTNHIDAQNSAFQAFALWFIFFTYVRPKKQILEVQPSSCYDSADIRDLRNFPECFLSWEWKQLQEQMQETAFQGPFVAPTPPFFGLRFLQSFPTRWKWYHCQVETVVKQGLELQLCVLECLILAGYDPQISRRDVTSASGGFDKKCWLVFQDDTPSSILMVHAFVSQTMDPSLIPEALHPTWIQCTRSFRFFLFLSSTQHAGLIGLRGEIQSRFVVLQRTDGSFGTKKNTHTLSWWKHGDIFVWEEACMDYRMNFYVTL